MTGRLSAPIAGLAILTLLAIGAPSHADLAILQYHHISNETPAATSTTPSLFRGQIDMIQDLELPVRSLREATRAALAGDIGEEPVVAITFDDAYSSVYDTAAPILLQRDMPFTIFVNTQAISEGRHGHMTWDQLRELAAKPQVTIGNHSADHGHLAQKPEEREETWRERVTTSLDQAQETLQEKWVKPLHFSPTPTGSSVRPSRSWSPNVTGTVTASTPGRSAKHRHRPVCPDSRWRPATDS